jgi:hypothetical protein
MKGQGGPANVARAPGGDGAVIGALAPVDHQRTVGPARVGEGGA